MSQFRLLDLVTDQIQVVAPDGWVVSKAVYVRLLQECLSDGYQVVVMPGRKDWVRTSKVGIRREYDVQVVIISRHGDVDLVDLDMIDQVQHSWAKLFLSMGGPFSDYPCFECESIVQAELGFNLDELTGTPGNFIGGLRLHFWDNGNE